jgi:hypothetical protein
MRTMKRGTILVKSPVALLGGMSANSDPNAGASGDVFTNAVDNLAFDTCADVARALDAG